MADKPKKELKKILDATLGSAVTLQGVKVLNAKGNVQRLAGTVPGFIGIGVSGTAAQIASNLILMPKKKRKRRK